MAPFKNLKVKSSPTHLIDLFKNQSKIFVFHVQAERVDDFKGELIKAPLAQYDELFFCDHHRNYLWPINSWGPLQLTEILSIKKAANFLKKLQRNWVHQPIASVRRAELIAQELPKISAKPISFPDSVPKAPLGIFSLLDNQNLIFSAKSSSPFVRAIPKFSDELTASPSQAYLKLWEALTRFGIWPEAHEKVLDVGSSPGSWTLALSRLSAKVISVDKAPLNDKVLESKNVEFLKADAFKIPDEIFTQVDWLFSDLICQPERLFELIQRAIRLNPKIKMLCTIKFMGEWKNSSIENFSKISASQMLHLYHNKHELSFLRFPS